MSKRDPRAKRTAIRKEIKERMQKELDDRKKEIKRQIKREDISVEEKRAKYRRRVRREKLRLLEDAKQEFRARKRMLGDVTGGEYEEEYDELEQDIIEVPESMLQWQPEEGILVDEREDEPEAHDAVDPREAFILEDTTEEREALAQFEGPIEEVDALPPEAGGFVPQPGVGAGFESEEFEMPGLFHYIYNLIFHPVITLDEFDDYLACKGGIRNVAIFYLLSIIPLVVFSYFVMNFGAEIAGGVTGRILESSSTQQADVLAIYGMTVLNLLIYSASIAIVNYLFTNEANFVTLTTYFAFVEGVTNVVIYTLIIAALLVAFIAPPILLIVGLLLLAVVVWRIALNVIVLMSAYGYGIITALLLVIGASVLLRIGTIFVSGAIFGKSLEETLYPE